MSRRSSRLLKLTHNGTKSTRTMPRNTQNGKKTHKEVNQWIFVAPESAVCSQDCGETEPVFIKIPHPRTGKELQFLLSHSGEKIFEVLRFKEESRSWFVDDSVQKDGSLHVITPVDPLFLILPYLTKFSQKFRTLEQLLVDEGHPSISRLTGCLTTEEILNICDVKGDDDLQVYRLNNDKAIAWLKVKVEQTADSVSSSGVHVSKGSQSATFVRSKRHTDASRVDYVRYAFGLVSDYLSSQWSESLKESLGITDEAQLSSPEGPPTKRVKVTDEIPEATEDYSKEFSKLNSKTENDKVLIMIELH
ncbi:Ribonuclease H2 subunit B [Desmophyllum pertusum]|uniref:Ribonuclease H2 subunit B n=1 Tax=Desmophyllum pertusum TaxID=174260 RepID=A0A9X0CWE7_9CNID|nr:Ribonuclease H2 subunit B [Desmophyllum pertusum]